MWTTSNVPLIEKFRKVRHLSESMFSLIRKLSWTLISLGSLVWRSWSCSHVIVIIRPAIIHPCLRGSQPDEVDVHGHESVRIKQTTDSERYCTFPIWTMTIVRYQRPRCHTYTVAKHTKGYVAPRRAERTRGMQSPTWSATERCRWEWIAASTSAHRPAGRHTNWTSQHDGYSHLITMVHTQTWWQYSRTFKNFFGEIAFFKNISTSNSSGNLQWLRGHCMSVIQTNVNLQRIIKHTPFKITKMDDE